MEILGLDWVIWAILAVYFAGMLAVGWWSKRGSYSSKHTDPCFAYENAYTAPE